MTFTHYLNLMGGPRGCIPHIDTRSHMMRYYMCSCLSNSPKDNSLTLSCCVSICDSADPSVILT